MLSQIIFSTYRSSVTFPISYFDIRIQSCIASRRLPFVAHIFFAYICLFLFRFNVCFMINSNFSFCRSE